MTVAGKNLIANNTEFLRNQIAFALGMGSGDTGYGQNVNVLQNVAKTTLTPAAFPTYSDAFKVLINHQTGGAGDVSTTRLPIPVAGEEPLGSVFDQYNDHISELIGSRLQYQPASMTLYPNAFSTVRNYWWGPQASIVSEVDFLWSNENNARYFFNSGGDIRMKPSQPSWSYLSKYGYTYRSGGYWWQIGLAMIGTVVFSAHATVSNGTTGNTAPNFGYYELTGSYTLVLNGKDFYNPYAYIAGYADIDDFYIYAMKIPNGVRFKIQLNEENRDQSVDPGTRVDFSYLRATQYLVNPPIQAPSFIVRTSF